MSGAVAAGHQLTAEAGARILAEGGNAVDACIAASFTSWVAESPLAGPGAGGFMLVHRARDRSSRLLDFFVAAPGLGALTHGHAEMESVDVDFEGGETTQVFRIGSASCAVPGAVAGLAAAHRAYATLPWRTLLEPAIELARRGLELTRPQAYLHAILDVILRHTGEGRRIYGNGSGRLAAGDLLRLPDLAESLQLLAESGPDALYGGELGRAIVDHLRETGGEITLDDLTGYRVIWRRPVRAGFRSHLFESNPPPSSGGVLIGYGLRLLDRLGRAGKAGSASATAALVEVMREQGRARHGRFATLLHRGALARRLYADQNVDAALGRMREGLHTPTEMSSVGGTTHISVVDGRGNAASLSASTGSGSGVIVPRTGVHLNNMLGEWDLNPAGRAFRPGRRLTSMMAPSIVLRSGEPRLVVGSAGSVRLRGAIMQVVVNVVEHDLPVAEAIDRPRVHLDEPHVHCEGGFQADVLDELERRGYDVVRWRRRNLFFGGAAAVEVRKDGSRAAAGDPRRGGFGVVVE
jgi:gamma-glutamyltranspeptidase / glutathione hydrolase